MDVHVKRRKGVTQVSAATNARNLRTFLLVSQFKVYLCQDGALYHGCWADIGGGVSDVTKQARAIKKYGGSDLGC